MGDLPLRTPTDRRHGGPLPRHQANQTHPHPAAINLSFDLDVRIKHHRALIRLSPGCSLPRGRLDTRYSPVRRSPSEVASNSHDAPRLACVRPVASVHPEPGSNSPLYNLISSKPSAPDGAHGVSVSRTPLHPEYQAGRKTPLTTRDKSPRRALTVRSCTRIPTNGILLLVLLSVLYVISFKDLFSWSLTGEISRKRMQRYEKTAERQTFHGEIFRKHERFSEIITKSGKTRKKKGGGKDGRRGKRARGRGGGRRGRPSGEAEGTGAAHLIIYTHAREEGRETHLPADYLAGS